MSANVAYKPDGLDSLLLEEEDIRSYEESKGDVGGIADLGPIRERMEKAGRYGDDRVAHVQTGELVVPKPLIDKFPELKASIFEHLREMGVEDPERYMVGDGENSINPETGLPEFGFFSSITRGLKSIVKSVGKVLKKVAPTLIKVAGTALLSTFMPAPFAAAISSGIGTLVGGGSIKDAAISAALGGATGYLAPSIGDTAAFALQGGAEAAIAGGNFGDVLKGAGMGAAGAAAGKIFGPTLKNILPEGLGGETIKDPFKVGIDALSSDIGRTGSFLSDVTSGEFAKAFQPTANIFSPSGYISSEDVLANAKAAQASEADVQSYLDSLREPSGYGPDGRMIESSGRGAADTYMFEMSPSTQNAGDPRYASLGGEGFINPRTGVYTPPLVDRLETIEMMDMTGVQPGVQVAANASQDNLIGGAGFDRLQQFTPFAQDEFKTASGDIVYGKDAVLEASKAAGVKAEEAFKDMKPGPAKDALMKNYIEKVTSDLDPNFAQKYGPAALGALGLMAATGGFEAPEMQKPNILPSGFGQQGVDPELVAKYRLSEGSLNTSPTRTSPISARVAPRRQSDILRRRFPDLFAAKDGGEVFPRRTGGIMPDEGVPGKDSVRAMVMPGEFIFTTDAVRGASPTGNLNDGINNMYSVMRKLESRGKRMA